MAMAAADTAEMPESVYVLQGRGEAVNLLFFQVNCPILNSSQSMNRRTSHVPLFAVVYSYINLIDVKICVSVMKKSFQKGYMKVPIQRLLKGSSELERGLGSTGVRL